LYRFLPDLLPSTMEVVLATAPRSHALALKNFFYNYLTGKAAIGVTIPVRFRTWYSSCLLKTDCSVIDVVSRIQSLHFRSAHPILRVDREQGVG
jgi:hypothetical protein